MYVYALDIHMCQQISQCGCRSEPKGPHNFGSSLSSYCQCHHLRQNNQGLFCTSKKEQSNSPFIVLSTHPYVDCELGGQGEGLLGLQARTMQSIIKTAQVGLYRLYQHLFLQNEQVLSKGKLKTPQTTPHSKETTIRSAFQICQVPKYRDMSNQVNDSSPLAGSTKRLFRQNRQVLSYNHSQELVA